MKSLTKTIVLCVVMGSMGSLSAQENPEDPDKLLRHLVVFKFKEEAGDAQVKEVIEAFLALPSKIGEIHSMDWGLNNSPEGLNKGLTHCFLLNFRSEADRDAYLPHPDHKAFTELAGPIIADVFVVDYWAKGSP